MKCLACIAIERTGMIMKGPMALLSDTDKWGAACCVTVFAMARLIRSGEESEACEKHVRMLRALDEPGGPFRAKDGTEWRL